MININATDAEHFEILTDRQDLTLISNALNEACNGIDTEEFATRLGVQREAALEMMNVIDRALSAVDGA